MFLEDPLCSKASPRPDTIFWNMISHLLLYGISSVGISCFPRRQKRHFFDKSPMFLCATASGVYFFLKQEHLLSKKHTFMTQSPVLLCAAASSVFFSPKKNSVWAKITLLWPKALFFCARRPPAFFFFTQKEHFLNRKHTCCAKNPVLLCAAASSVFVLFTQK